MDKKFCDYCGKEIPETTVKIYPPPDATESEAEVELPGVCVGEDDVADICLACLAEQLWKVVRKAQE